MATKDSERASLAAVFALDDHVSDDCSGESLANSSSSMGSLGAVATGGGEKRSSRAAVMSGRYTPVLEEFGDEMHSHTSGEPSPTRRADILALEEELEEDDEP